MKTVPNYLTNQFLIHPETHKIILVRAVFEDKNGLHFDVETDENCLLFSHEEIKAYEIFSPVSA